MEPYDDFRVSHGVCQSCAANIRSLSYKKLDGVIDFFRMLFSRVESGEPLDPKKVILDSIEIGISQADLLLGILQPILYKIGLCFAEGKLSVAKEHLFSEAVSAITQEFERTLPPSTDSRIILALSEHNVHYLGVDFLSLLIAERLGCRVRKLRNLTTKEMAELIKNEKPRFFGLSAALPEHWLSMVELNQLLETSLRGEDKPLLALGGSSLKRSAAGKPFDFIDFTANCFDCMETLEFLKKRVLTDPQQKS